MTDFIEFTYVRISGFFVQKLIPVGKISVRRSEIRSVSEHRTENDLLVTLVKLRGYAEGEGEVFTDEPYTSFMKRLNV
jgi:hypothetical protein